MHAVGDFMAGGAEPGNPERLGMIGVMPFKFAFSKARLAKLWPEENP